MCIYPQVKAEDAGVLIMLVHHSSSTNNPLFLTTLKGSYNDRGIWEALSERQKRHLLLVMHSLVVIQFLLLWAMEKPIYMYSIGFVQDHG